ncbi:hypothetical protein HK096_005094 [Nowakowskiella sp. JEL0078]|nr:hypothetical protein HK096_005094 [Nowakowskiella sp. JEL0078]
MLYNNFELKPMRRRSAQVYPQSALQKQDLIAPVSQMTGADYFLSSRIEHSLPVSTQRSQKDSVTLYKVDNPNRLETAFRRRSAPASPVPTKIISSLVTSPVSVSENVFNPVNQRAFPKPPPVLSKIATPPTLPQSLLKRSASTPVILKSCIQRKLVVEEVRRKSVQFFGFVQVQYTHSKADYDRSTIGCLANPVETREETTEEFKQWQQEMNEILIEKRPESPCPPFCSSDSDLESVSSALDSEDESETKRTDVLDFQIAPTVSKLSSFTPNIKAPVFVPSSYIQHVESATF